MTNTPPANPAAAEHNITVVNDCSLPRRYRALRLVQSHMSAIVLERGDCRSRSGMVIADLDGRFEAHGGRSSCDAGLAGARPSMKASRDIACHRMPVHTINLEFLREQIVGVADDDAIRFRV